MAQRAIPGGLTPDRTKRPIQDISARVDYNLSMSKQLSHIDETGRARMVDVGRKPETERSATARGEVRMRPETLALIQAGAMKKGDVLTVAQLAGVMGAKRTAELIPLCHPLSLTHIDVVITPGS